MNIWFVYTASYPLFDNFYFVKYDNQILMSILSLLAYPYRRLQYGGLIRRYLRKVPYVFAWTAIVECSKWDYWKRPTVIPVWMGGCIRQNLYLIAESSGLGCLTLGRGMIWHHLHLFKRGVKVLRISLGPWRRNMVKKGILLIILIFVLLVGCDKSPVREEVKVDRGLPVGKIEGNQFVGIRFPFKISAPPHWKVTTEFPDFMEELGYGREGLESSQLFIFNPSTNSNLQIDFQPAGRSVRFSQAMIESLTGMVTEGVIEEFKDDYGKDLQVRINPTERISLKGVQYAAKKYITFAVDGVNREQGWIYAFTEPYQIFILYVILKKEGTNDREDLKKILDSFEVVSKK